MAVLFLGLNDKGDGWEKLGCVHDSKIRDDRTRELEQLLDELPYLDDEERLTQHFVNHYVNAVIVEGDSNETPLVDQ